MGYLLLGLAILSEVVATTSLKLSEGFSRVGPSVLVVAGYLAAFALLAQALTRGVPLSVAYGLWAGAGVALVAVAGTLLLGESLTSVQVGGIVLETGAART